jgi:Na+/melibiose symporter-like transporter
MSAETQTAGGSLFQNRFIRAIIVSGILLQTGIWIRNFAILLYVTDMTNNDPISVSLISIAEFSPIFIFSFIGGTFADRWRPKRTMIWCDLLSAISVFVVLLTLLFGTWKAVFFATFVSAILSQFSQPSAMKLFKVHVPEHLLQRGMAMFQTMMAIFMIIGPILGTYFYQQFGIYVSIGVMGAAFLLSALALTFLPKDIVEETERKDSDFWKELQDGFRYVWSRMPLRTLGASFALAGLAVGFMQPLGIFLVIERLGQEKDFLQWLMMANGVAMLFGGGLVAGLAKQIAPARLLAIGLLASAVSVSVVGLSTSVTLTLVFQFLNGLFFPCIHIGINTLILQSTDSQFVGRVNGVLNPLFMGMMVVTMSTAGVLKSALTLVVVYQISAVLFALAMLVLVPLFKLKNHPSGENRIQQAAEGTS